jgi:hypothetical protein
MFLYPGIKKNGNIRDESGNGREALLPFVGEISSKRPGANPDKVGFFI